MLVVTSKIAMDAISYLNENHKNKNDITVLFIPGYETMSDAEGNIDFSVFDSNTMELFIPTLILDREEISEEHPEPKIYTPDDVEYQQGIVERIASAYYKVLAFEEEKEVTEEDRVEFCNKVLRGMELPEIEPTPTEEVTEGEVVEETTESVEE